ncbi:TetR/AcrR family transcriptional regulator [Microbacterium sp. RD1]|uniref:TetR/AcrR family transcriptional regulator n=1 Tax=Microbacterium sp. RD1 TaxID=3457313 RepID=UPI003FA54855
MTDVASTPRRREATRQRLLDAAAAVFAEVGLDATSVEAVCERAGFTRGAFYSNFASKEELFLELAATVTSARVAEVAERVAQLEAQGGFEGTAVEIVDRVLDLPGDDRLGVLLMSEIRMHALRNPEMASAFLQQDADVCGNIVRLIDDIAAATGLRLMLPAAEAARLLLSVWEATVTRAVMAGLDRTAARREIQESIAGVVPLLIARS